jgi:hypothetical protein
MLQKKHTKRASGRKQQQINARHTHTIRCNRILSKQKTQTMQEKQRAMRWMAKEKICPMVARTKRTDGRTRFFGSLTQLSLSSSSVGRISSYSPTEKVGSHNSCE